jgi:16S rRNA processing protein RimM
VDATTNWVTVGRFGRPHGIKGFVKVHSFTDPPDNILSYAQWYAFLGKVWQPVQLITVKAQNNGIIALVEGYADRELVTRLTNVDIGIKEECLAELAPGEFYWHELVGMRVINQQGEPFGEVIDVMPTGANDVLVVKGEKKHLIPYLPGQVIIDINKSQQQIIVDWDMDF